MLSRPVGVAATEKTKMKFVTAVPPITYLICGNPDHQVKEYQIFKKMDYDDRWKVVQTHYQCRICLGKHGRKPWQSSTRCDVQGCQWTNARVHCLTFERCRVIYVTMATSEFGTVQTSN